MRISPTTTRHRGLYKSLSVRSGFTLIEVMLVVGIIAMMAAMALPKRFFFYDPPLRVLQQTIMEITDLVLDGHRVRLRMEVAERTDRGHILVETLSRVEDQFDPTKYTLEWKPLEIRHPLEGDEWRLEPEIVYFYSDGTCTPARILWADKDTRITEGDAALLTVTGFLFEANGS